MTALRDALLRVALTQVGLLLGAGASLALTAGPLLPAMPLLWLGVPAGLLATGAAATAAEVLLLRRRAGATADGP